MRGHSRHLPPSTVWFAEVCDGIAFQVLKCGKFSMGKISFPDYYDFTERVYVYLLNVSEDALAYQQLIYS